MRLGEYDLLTDDGDHLDVLVSHVDRHANWSYAFLIHDIAVVHLEVDVEFTGELISKSAIASFVASVYILCFLDHIKPICLPLDDDIVKRRFVGSNPWLVGWGYMAEDDNELSNTPQQVQVPGWSSQVRY